MLALAAARLGFRCHVYCARGGLRRPTCVQHATCADYDDVAALDAVRRRRRRRHLRVRERAGRSRDDPRRRGAACCPTARRWRRRRTGWPRRASSTRARRRARAAYAAIDGAELMRAAIAQIGLPAVLKTRRVGYDGKGQAHHPRRRRAPTASGDDRGTAPAILEASCRSSARSRSIAARGADGERRLLRRRRERAPRPHPETSSRRAGRRSPSAWPHEARGDRRARSPTRSTMSACWRSRCSCCASDDGASAAGQRDRAARAQFRPLDDRRRLGLAVRAAHPRDRRLAARRAACAHGAVEMTNLIGDEIDRCSSG